jgi:1,4-alpha-glucan branching enzyme
LRVLTLTSEYPPVHWSGIARAVATQVEAVARLGAEVCVVVPPAHPALPDPPAGVTVHRLGGDQFPVDPRCFDIVHVHTVAFAEFGLELRRRFELPLVVTAHGLLGRELGPDASPIAAVQSAVMEAADHLVVLSPSEHAAAVDLIPTIGDRCTVVPNAITAVDPPPIAPRPSERPGPVVFAGRFTRSKGIALLADVWSRIGRGPHRRLVLAGGHGDDDGERVVARLVREHPATCRCVGWLRPSELDALFAGAGVVVVPSAYEPFGMVALEALRMGAPVLAADAGGLPGIVTPGSGGWLVPTRDAATWSQMIDAVLDRPELRATCRRLGPAHVARRFDPLAMAATLMSEVYLRLRARPSRRAVGAL